MGTNYYLIKQNGEICPHCKRGESTERIHIGKSSAGWCFGLHVMPEDGIKSLDDWKPLFLKHPIENEYGENISPEAMLSEITERSWPIKPTPHGYKSWADFHRDNHSCAGPNGLARHNYAGNLYGHGEGTWDYCTGEFS